MRPLPIQVARPLIDRPRLQVVVVYAVYRHHLGVVARREQFVRIQKFGIVDNALVHAVARVAQQRQDALARDSIQKGAVGVGRVYLAVLGRRNDDRQTGKPAGLGIGTS